MKDVKYVLLLVVCLVAIFEMPFLIKGSVDPARNIKEWETVVVAEKNTRVWCLARKAAGGEYNVQDVVILIRDKNPWLAERNFTLRTGDKILVPVLQKKQLSR
jgi:hypothetical protein